jgi:hypothetical protein
MKRALDGDPANDQLRFGLGVIQFVRAVERLGQSLHKYGVKSGDTDFPFLRIPVPGNNNPAPITYPILRQILWQFTEDLARAEATLAGITDPSVTLPLRLAGVQLDLRGTGLPTEKLLGIVGRVAPGGRPNLPNDNPEFLVKFDRGDVAWLRGYCHLLTAMLELYLALDGQFFFDGLARQHFGNPKG